MRAGDDPVDKDEFAELMQTVGLTPEVGSVAVAVSGGADSLALALLTARWGETVALTVDHGLRPDSADEARRVADWLAARGIAHHTLIWEGDKPKTGLQAAARTARYRLMEAWCRANGVDALLLAHHRDDQAETFLLRLARGSGLSGLAGMAPVSPPLTEPDLGAPRRCRPLLETPKSRLEATCRSFDQNWIEDPSNRDPAFRRTQARALLGDPPLPGMDAAGLAATAQRLRRARRALEAQVDALLAESVRIEPAGYAVLDRCRLRAAPEEVALRMLTQLLATVGGLGGPPRGERVERAFAQLITEFFTGLTTAGCQIVPRTGSAAALCREPAAVAPPIPLAPGSSAIWDGRFRVRNDSDRAMQVGALGEAGWRALKAREETVSVGVGLPEPVRVSLPAFRSEETILAVPHLGLMPSGNAVAAKFLGAEPGATGAAS